MTGFLLFTAFFLVSSLPLHAQEPGCDVEGYRRDRPCGGTNKPSKNQGNASSVNRTQLIQNAIGAMGAAMEQSARQQALREQRQAEEDARRLQQEQARQQQINQQMQSAAARAQNDPVLNPFASQPTGGATIAGGAPPSEPPAALNANDNYTGQSCRWLVVRDEETCGSRSCFYTEGQTVAIGPRAYRCEQGRWALLRDCNQSPLAHQRTACQTDIANIYGLPGSKETPAQKIYSHD